MSVARRPLDGVLHAGRSTLRFSSLASPKSMGARAPRVTRVSLRAYPENGRGGTAHILARPPEREGDSAPPLNCRKEASSRTSATSATGRSTRRRSSAAGAARGYSTRPRWRRSTSFISTRPPPRPSSRENGKGSPSNRGGRRTRSLPPWTLGNHAAPRPSRPGFTTPASAGSPSTRPHVSGCRIGETAPDSPGGHPGGLGQPAPPAESPGHNGRTSRRPQPPSFSTLPATAGASSRNPALVVAFSTTSAIGGGNSSLRGGSRPSFLRGNPRPRGGEPAGERTLEIRGGFRLCHRVGISL
jgi:hypothetical protein